MGDCDRPIQDYGEIDSCKPDVHTEGFIDCARLRPPAANDGATPSFLAKVPAPQAASLTATVTCRRAMLPRASGAALSVWVPALLITGMAKS
jgi:hypothetical protein